MKKLVSILFLTLSISSYAQDEFSFQGESSEQLSNEPYSIVDQMPVYPGGEKALLDYLQKNTKYPKKDVDSNIQGTVNVEFVINEDGSISNAKILKGLDSDFNQEALRVVREMPMWRPGRQNGKPVKVFYTIPILFSLN